VTIVLNGHDHDYQRWVPLDADGNPSPNGVTEFVSGAGGHGHQSGVSTDSRLAASDFTDFGALRLALGSSGAGYSYYVVARDAAGNLSQPSSTASVTLPADVTMFSDGFESGDMSQWTTSTGITVQNQLVNDGSYAAEAVAGGAPAYAYEQLGQTRPSLYYSTRFYVRSHGSGSAYLLRLRTANKGAIVAVYVSSTGKLGMRNDVAGIPHRATPST